MTPRGRRYVSSAVQIDAIGVAPRLRVADTRGGIVEERAFESEGFDHDAAMREILSVGAKLLRGASVAGFGHRVWRRFISRTISPPFAQS